MELFDRYNAKRLMKEKNITGKELAEKIGYTSKDVSRWMTGHVNPREDKIKKIARVLDTNTRTLMRFVPDNIYEELKYIPTEVLLDEIKKRMLKEDEN